VLKLWIWSQASFLKWSLLGSSWHSDCSGGPIDCNMRATSEWLNGCLSSAHVIASRLACPLATRNDRPFFQFGHSNGCPYRCRIRLDLMWLRGPRQAVINDVIWSTFWVARLRARNVESFRFEWGSYRACVHFAGTSPFHETPEAMWWIRPKHSGLRAVNQILHLLVASVVDPTTMSVLSAKCNTSIPDSVITPLRAGKKLPILTRMIRLPAPAPWIPRPAMSIAKLFASAHTRLPTRKMILARRRIGFRPKISLQLAQNGVMAAWVSRQAEPTHEYAVWDALKSLAIYGKAVVTTATSRAAGSVAIHNAVMMIEIEALVRASGSSGDSAASGVFRVGSALVRHDVGKDPHKATATPASVTYVDGTEAATTNPPLQAIFASHTQVLKQTRSQ